MTSAALPCFTARAVRSDGALQTQRSWALVAAYRGWGGSVHASQLSALLMPSVMDAATMTRWLLAGDLVSFRLGACWHVPLFQFCCGGLGVRRDVSRVVDELRTCRDGMAVAEWFVRPNPRLDSCWPVAMLDRDHDAVLRAARADEVR